MTRLDRMPGDLPLPLQQGKEGEEGNEKMAIDNYAALVGDPRPDETLVIDIDTIIDDLAALLDEVYDFYDQNKVYFETTSYEDQLFLWKLTVGMHKLEAMADELNRKQLDKIITVDIYPTPIEPQEEAEEEDE